jgi:hypothetical protein
MTRGVRARVLLALLLVSSPVLAADPPAAAPQLIELRIDGAQGWADATAEAARNAAQCAQTPAGCARQAPAPRSLVEDRMSCGGGTSVFGWRKAEDLTDGVAKVRELTDRATRREVFACADGTSCLGLFFTTGGRDGAAGITTVSVCRLRVIAGQQGAPTACEEAAKTQPGQAALVKALVGQGMTACSMGMPDFDVVFTGSAADADAVRRLVQEVLQSAPFNLAVAKFGDSLMGTRTQLASLVMTGWREWVTVRADVESRAGRVGVTLSTTLLVSKQASASREAWSPPETALESRYLNALRQALQRRGGSIELGRGR